MWRKPSREAESSWHTPHGYSRLVTFCDAVVAIAITLLILPLVDAAKSVGTMTAGQFTVHNTYGLFVFLLSFAVIGFFWIIHHRLYERVTGYTNALIWANLLWLISIVFLPFPTQLLGSSDRSDVTTYFLYVGTMIVTCGSIVIQIAIIKGHPDIQAERARGTLTLQPAIIITVLMMLALVIAVTVPQIGLWALALTAAHSPINRLLTRRPRA